MDNLVLTTPSGDCIELCSVPDILKHIGCHGEALDDEEKNRHARYIVSVIAEAVDEMIYDSQPGDPDCGVTIQVQ